MTSKWWTAVKSHLQQILRRWNSRIINFVERWRRLAELIEDMVATVLGSVEWKRLPYKLERLWFAILKISEICKIETINGDNSYLNPILLKIGGVQEQSCPIKLKINWRVFNIEALERIQVPIIDNVLKFLKFRHGAILFGKVTANLNF